jgi:hypothetical protein
MPGGILTLAESDLSTSLESDFGRLVSITFQSGVKNVYGQVNRINALTDPQTGLMVNIPRISVTVRISSLQSENLINNLDVSTTDITGDTITGKVINSKPDLTLGFITFEISEKKSNQTKIDLKYAGTSV